MKKIFIPLLSFLTLTATTGCKPDKSVSNEAPSKTTVTKKCDTHKDNMLGTYCGTFPCADGPGKQVELSLFEDSVYTLTYCYLETKENPEIIEECGIYTVTKDTLVVTITPSSNEKTYYVYTQGKMVLSDSIGTINQSELADLYVLTKDSVQLD